MFIKFCSTVVSLITVLYCVENNHQQILAEPPEDLSILHCALEGPRCKFTGVGAVASDLPAQINKKKGKIISANIMPLYPSIKENNLIDVATIEHDVLGIKVKTKIFFSASSQVFYCKLLEDVANSNNKPIQTSTTQNTPITFKRLKSSVKYVTDAKKFMIRILNILAFSFVCIGFVLLFQNSRINL